MTREEREDAIDIIQSILNKYEEDECLVTEITIGNEDIKAFKMAIEALAQEPCEDVISCETVIEWLKAKDIIKLSSQEDTARKELKALSSVKSQDPRWIPVSERLPKELEPVNVTWINHNPESYHADIKDKPFTATGVYFNGQWYWWSTLCTDILAEYSHNYDDIIDDDIEITAWMPLPTPFESQESEDKK